MLDFHLGGRHDFRGFAGNECYIGPLTLSDPRHIVGHKSHDDIFRSVVFAFMFNMAEATGNRSHVH